MIIMGNDPSGKKVEVTNPLVKLQALLDISTEALDELPVASLIAWECATVDEYAKRHGICPIFLAERILECVKEVAGDKK